MEREIIRIDDVLHDKRAAPVRLHQRKRQPVSVRSYLAVPVISRRARCWAGCCSVIPRPACSPNARSTWWRALPPKPASHSTTHALSRGQQERGALPAARRCHAADRLDGAAGRPVRLLQSPLVRLHRAHRSCAGRSGLDDLIHPEDCQACREKWREALKSNQSFQANAA